jgi:hypothetical protein
MEKINPRLLAFGLFLVTIYAVVIAATVAHIGDERMSTDEGFYRFCAIALAASPLALAALVLTRLATGRLLLVMVAAGSCITVLLRISRGEATSQGLAFSGVFLAVLLIIEIAVSRRERQ